MDQMDKDKIGKVCIIGMGVVVASFLLAWGGGLDWLSALKASALTTGGWLMGHLQRTGEVGLTTEGLKK